MKEIKLEEMDQTNLEYALYNYNALQELHCKLCQNKLSNDILKSKLDAAKENNKQLQLELLKKYCQYIPNKFYFNILEGTLEYADD